MGIGRLLAVALVGLMSWASVAVGGENDWRRAEFSVLHFTDVHVGPCLDRLGKPDSVRGQETIDWMLSKVGGTQLVDVYDMACPAPAFALATGDITEYGVIDSTWEVFKETFSGLKCPIYSMPGNHDNTWTCLYRVMREEHGGENYSFDHEGIHFVCISSASPQEPVPCIDAKTRAWLKADLDKAGKNTPVVLSLHHPMYTTEFAHPVELDTLYELLRDYNVELMLWGHGHGVSVRKIAGIPGVMGGSTFGKYAGYGLLSFKDGHIRYAYRYHKGNPKAKGKGKEPESWRAVFDREIKAVPSPRLVTIEAPASGGQVVDNLLKVKLAKPEGVRSKDEVTTTLSIDGEERVVVDGRAGWNSALSLPVKGLTPGKHLLSVWAKGGDVEDVRTRVFEVTSGDVEVVWQKQFPAAFKAGPIWRGDVVVLAGNDGVFRCLDSKTGEEKWQFATGGEILGEPARTTDSFIFGSGDGKVYALDRSGTKRWEYDAGDAVYGWPVVNNGIVYVGDNGGRMHAIKLDSGEKVWVFERADFGIEAKAEVWGDNLLFGAWDSYVYAVNKADGKLVWKSIGPKASQVRGSRYYAAADCGPVVVSGRLFVCDRGYHLGVYTSKGELKENWDSKAAGIEATGDGHVVVRTTDGHVRKRDRDGNVVWDVEVPAGRFPIPPTIADGKVYVCSNTGLLSVLNESDGKLLWQYQATPGFYVMGSVDVARDGTCYVAGMDGSVTAVRYRQNTLSTRQGT